MSKRNIPLFKIFMANDVLVNLQQVIMSGYVGQGPKVDEFEKMLSNYFSNPFVNTVNCGTSAIHLALRLIKDRYPDQPQRTEVLTTPLTCTATNFPILANNLDIRWVDVSPKDCNMDLDDLERKISPKTLAIMVVHWGGYPVDLDRIDRIVQRCLYTYGFAPYVIQDCAHALGASYKGHVIGSPRLGHFHVFSFQAIKHITTGDGGLLISPLDELHRKAKLLRWYGLDRTSSADFRCEQNIVDWGYKFHMNDIAAAIGLANFPNLDNLLAKHRQNAMILQTKLRGIKGIKVLELSTDRQSAYWVFTIQVERRNEFMTKMKEQGIGVSMVHDRNDKHDCLRQYRSLLPGTNEICADMCSIPCGWWVDQNDIDYMTDCFKKGW